MVRSTLTKLICPPKRKSDAFDKWNCNSHSDRTHEMEVYFYVRESNKQKKCVQTGYVLLLETTSRFSGSVKSGAAHEQTLTRNTNCRQSKTSSFFVAAAIVQRDYDMKNALAGAWTVMKLCCSNSFDGWLVYWVIDLWKNNSPISGRCS